MICKCCYKKLLTGNGIYKISKFEAPPIPHSSYFIVLEKNKNDGFPRGKKQNRSVWVMHKITWVKDSHSDQSELSVF